jgi:uncharacterized pyridoxamine 5'-phosphate oxidase family protein
MKQQVKIETVKRTVETTYVRVSGKWLFVQAQTTKEETTNENQTNDA